MSKKKPIFYSAYFESEHAEKIFSLITNRSCFRVIFKDGKNIGMLERAYENVFVIHDIPQKNVKDIFEFCLNIGLYGEYVEFIAEKTIHSIVREIPIFSFGTLI